MSRPRVLRAAVDIADRDGLDALTMRRLAQELGVEAMSLYHHVANKDAILDGATEVVLDEVNDAVARLDGPSSPEEWHGVMRRRILTARAIMLRHPWAPRLLQTRASTSPAVLTYFDALLGIFVAGGFSYDLAHHALHALGSQALGFNQELFAPDDAETGDDASAMLEQLSGRLPHLTAMMADVVHDHPDSTLGWCDDQTEFEFGLDLILDGLERRRTGT